MSEKNSFRKLIFNDKYLIITALILAVLVWVVTSLNIGTDETRTIHIDAPIKLSDELQEQLGMKYYTLQSSVGIDVTISGAKYVIGQVNADDLKIKYDTSNVTRAGEQSVPIQVTNKSKTKDFSITSIYPSSIDAYFDVEETKDFDVSIVYDESNVADGYIFGTPGISEDTVTVKGPKSYVDLIQDITAEVDFENNKKLKETYSQECRLQIKGSGVEPNYITIYSKNDPDQIVNTVDVTIPVLKVATLPVSVDFYNSPKTIEKDSQSIKYSVDKLKVGMLEKTEVSKAVIGKINYNDINIGKNEFKFKTADIQGVVVMKGEEKEVTVTVDVSADKYKEVSLPINTSTVTVKGVPAGSTAKVRRIDKYRVRIITPNDVELKESDITVVADISKIDGNKCPLEIKVKDKSSWVVSDYSATVSVTKD